MKSITMPKPVFHSVIAFAVILANITTFAQQATNWTTQYDQNGRIESLVIKNPQTYLGIEREIRIETDALGFPVSGTVVYNDSISRQLGQLEMNGAFEKFNGPQIVLESAKSRDLLTACDPSRQEISTDSWNRRSWAVTNTENKSYFGQLLTMNKNPHWFKLNVDGSLISFYRPVVGQLLQIKRELENETPVAVHSAAVAPK